MGPIVETDFTPWASLAGGALIGLSAVMVMALFGKIAGIAGITNGALGAVLPMGVAPRDRGWRLAFILGLIAAPLLYQLFGGTVVQTVSGNLPGMALAGLLAGWLSENTSAGMLVCLVLAGAVVFKRERRLPAWMATGLAGALVGFALLITARGNFNRASGFSDYDSLLTRYAMRFFACLNMLKDYALPLLFSFAILFLLLCFARQDAVKADLLWPLILLAGALGANFAMIGSHDYYPRSTHGVFALLAAACAACLVQLNSKAFRRGLACLSACVGIVCGIHMLEAGYDIASYWMMDHVRTQTLRQEISELDEPAAANIISYGIEPYTKWCGAYGLPDIRENGEDSLALGRARWFGVTSITATETRTYPFAGHTNETYAAGEAAAENAESMD